MRKFIVDTDIGSDDAVALMLALSSPEVEVVAVTGVAGNCGLDNVVNNALMTIEVMGKQTPPVYRGAADPIFRKQVDAVNVHGTDGMGDCNIIHPKGKEAPGHAVNAILSLVKQYPDEIEIIALGPVTNIALAIMMDRATMKHVKRIWSMGTGGHGMGNTSPYAEFNVLADPEAYEVMLRSGIPITIAGFDLCIQSGGPLLAEDMELLLHSGKPVAEFAAKCNVELQNYNVRLRNDPIVDLPDAVAMAVALWDDLVWDAPMCYCETCTTPGPFYGQVAVYAEDRREFLNEYDALPHPVTVVRKMDIRSYKERLMSILLA